MTFRHCTQLIVIPSTVPISNEPPTDIQSFLEHMAPALLATIEADPLCAIDGRQPEFILKQFHQHILAKTRKTKTPLWLTYDPEKTTSSYQIWFLFKLTYFLRDQRMHLAATAPPANPHPVQAAARDRTPTPGPPTPGATPARPVSQGAPNPFAEAIKLREPALGLLNQEEQWPPTGHN